MWIKEVANELISKNPKKKKYTIQVGISTTGRIHVGNAREVLIAFFVNSYLQKLGYKTKFLLSFDDYDRLKKIPYGGDTNIYSQYLGKPNYLAPSVDSKDEEGYAATFERIFLQELASLDIFPQPIYQWEKYTNGSYKKYIELFYNRRSELNSCIQKFKTKNQDNICGAEFVPFILYCENCNSSNVSFESLSDDSLTYHCSMCGTTKMLRIPEIKNAKLIFKADWAMRWVYEKVDFEPNGKAHMDKNGAFRVASEIAQQFLSFQPPFSIPYEFVKLKGSNARMSKSEGNIITLTDLLEIFSPEMILWQYIRTNPSSELYLCDDEWVKNIYAEYEQFIKDAIQQPDNEEMQLICDLCRINPLEVTPTFKMLLDYIPFCDGCVANLPHFMPIDIVGSPTIRKANYAMNWYKKMSKSVYTLTVQGKDFLQYLLNRMEIDRPATARQLIDIIAEALTVNNLKNYSMLYQLLFGVENGPRLSKIIDVYGIDWFCKRLEEANERASA